MSTWESTVQNWTPDASGLIFCNWKIEIWTCPELKSWHIQIWNFAIEKLKSEHVRNWNLDVSVIKIRMCPYLKSGHVWIWNISLIDENLDTSIFFFLIGNKNLATSWFQFLDLRIKDPDWQNDKWAYGLDSHMDYDIVGDKFFQSRFFSN